MVVVQKEEMVLKIKNEKCCTNSENDTSAFILNFSFFIFNF
jgi:hypothetical protein